MSLRRGGTPLTGAVPSLEASNQAQIDDLVQRNRTLEHLNKKLSDQLSQEAARTKEAVLEIQRQWDVNQLQWKEGCEDILASYRIVQKQVEVELERERSTVIREMKITREEKLQRLQRDYKIKLFQMKEEELERRIEELEEEKAYMAEEHEMALRTEREKCDEYAAELKTTRESLAKIARERDDKETKYNKLVAQHSNLEAATGTQDSKLQRTQLQLEGVQTRLTDLERINDELKRSNGELTRQLERWQNLETKGGEAAEKQHKQRITLELQLQELKEKYEAQTEQDARELDKANKRLEKQKNVTNNYEAEAKDQAKAVAEAQKQLAKQKKQIDKLKAELEEERSRTRPPSPQKAKGSSPPNAVEIAEIEIIDDESTAATKPKAKQASTANAGPSNPAKPTKARAQVARKTTGGRPPPSRKAVPSDDGISEPEDEEEIRRPDKKGKARATDEVEEVADETEDVAPRKRAGKRKAVEEHNTDEDDNIEEIQEVPAPRKRAPKRKAAEDNNGGDEIEIVEKPKASKKGSRAPSVVREVPPAKKPVSRKKEGSRAPSKQAAAKPDADEEDEESDAAPKKKKRRMIFATGKPPGPFEFGGLTNFDNGGLNIPSVLSPVKPDELVPQRSTASASLMSGIGSIIKMPFKKAHQ